MRILKPLDWLIVVKYAELHKYLIAVRNCPNPILTSRANKKYALDAHLSFKEFARKYSQSFAKARSTITKISVWPHKKPYKKPSKRIKTV